MQIRKIALFQVDLPLHEGSYNWSGGKSVQVFDSTIVRIETDTGLAGYGEVCPLGSVYLPAYANGVRAGITEIAQDLIGQDPTQLNKLNRKMDELLKGHPYVKSAIDIACWDILGQAVEQPVCHLLGGRFGEDFCSLSSDFQGYTERHGRERQSVPRRRLPEISIKGWQRRRNGHRTNSLHPQGTPKGTMCSSLTPTPAG